jgi:hypothetical protein
MSGTEIRVPRKECQTRPEGRVKLPTKTRKEERKRKNNENRTGKKKKERKIRKREPIRRGQGYTPII